MVTKLAVVLLGALASVVISRALGPEGRGEYFVIVTVATTARALGHLSLEQAGISMFSRGVANWATLTTTVILVGLVTGVVAAVAAFLIVAALGPSVVPVSSYVYLTIALVGVPTGILVLGLGSQLLLGDRVPTFNAGKLLAAAVQCFGLIALGIVGKLSVGAVIVLWSVGTALPLVLYLAAARPRAAQIDLKLARGLLSTGAKYHAGMAALFLLWRIDVLILNPRVSAREVGLYSLAVTIAELAYFIAEGVGQAVISRQVGSTMSEAPSFTARVARSNLLFAVLLLTPIVIAAPIAVPLVFGDEYRGSVLPLVVLAPGAIGIAVARAILPYLVRLDRPLAVSGLALTALAVNILLNLLLIPQMGITGASLASTVAYGLLAVAVVIWLVRSGGLPARELLPRPTADAIRPLILAVRS